jgi:hypothetical protein
MSGHNCRHNLPFALLARYLQAFQCGNLTKVLVWPMGYEA